METIFVISVTTHQFDPPTPKLVRGKLVHAVEAEVTEKQAVLSRRLEETGYRTHLNLSDFYVRFIDAREAALNLLQVRRASLALKLKELDGVEKALLKQKQT
jgi:hypothetical protein